MCAAPTWQALGYKYDNLPPVPLPSPITPMARIIQTRAVVQFQALSRVATVTSLNIHVFVVPKGGWVGATWPRQ